MAAVLEDVDALPDLNPVSGEAAERLLHRGEQRRGARSAGLASGDHQFGEELRPLVGRHEGSAADLDVEYQSVQVFGEFLAHDARADQERRFHRSGMVAHRVEDTVGGHQPWSLADQHGVALAQDLHHARQRELRVEAGNRLQLVERPAGVAEAAATDHRDGDARRALESRSGQHRRDEQRGLVADAACGVLVHGEGVERRGVKGLAGEAHGSRQVGGLAQ